MEIRSVAFARWCISDEMTWIRLVGYPLVSKTGIQLALFCFMARRLVKVSSQTPRSISSIPHSVRSGRREGGASICGSPVGPDSSGSGMAISVIFTICEVGTVKTKRAFA